jgi:hypothetical protein
VIQSPILKCIRLYMLTPKFENRQAREYRGATVFQIQANISNRIILDFWRLYVEGNNRVSVSISMSKTWPNRNLGWSWKKSLDQVRIRLILDSGDLTIYVVWRAREDNVTVHVLWGIYPRIPSWLYMGRIIRDGLAHKIKACTARLQGVLDIVIVPNQILYL